VEENKDIILTQFDALLKRIVKNTVIDYYKKISREAERTIHFSELSELEENQLYTCDEYDLDYTSFEVLGFGKVIVHNEELAKALEKLTEKKRNTILMHYFLNISDSDIAVYLNVNRSTSYRERKNSLNEIRKILKEEAV
jgi:RNA polymerase sigma factor (sigma-70 family)